MAVNHREAAGRHEMAAKNHERAARFWAGKGDAERAGLQREMAEYERRGATLERRWAELVEWEVVYGQTRAAERVTSHTRRGARQLTTLLTRMADALDKSARLADEHATKRERAGRSDDAELERQAAQRARDSAEQARSHAAQWRDAHPDPET